MDGLQQKLEKTFHVPKNAFYENNKNELYVVVDEEEFNQIIPWFSQEKLSLVTMFAVEDFKAQSGFTLFYVFEKTDYPQFLILQRKTEKHILSIIPFFPSACWYEREITDGFGIVFENSLDSRRLFLHEAYPADFHPLQKAFSHKRHTLNPFSPHLQREYEFKNITGEGVYQIPVGPVHAGIIEPGHFRFSVIGETIFNLEIRMFWKHRGIEKLSENKSPEDALLLAEAISGDETVANALAFCLAVEQIAHAQIPSRAKYLRLVFAEMERIYSLLGDLAGMIVDVAYPVGASPFFVLREEILRWNRKLSGSRFYKNALLIGGIKQDVSQETLQQLLHYLRSFLLRFHEAVNHVCSEPSVIDRLETTGVVKQSLVWALHLTGPLAQASGIAVDTRKTHPYHLYQTLSPSVKTYEAGDVYARFLTKVSVIEDSLRLVKQAVQHIPSGLIHVNVPVKDGFALSVVESSRGQNAHWVYINKGVIKRYKIRTASFCNWLAIEHAVLGNIVPDFPLINKSMNLSYAGTDL